MASRDWPARRFPGFLAPVLTAPWSCAFANSIPSSEALIEGHSPLQMERIPCARIDLSSVATAHQHSPDLIESVGQGIEPRDRRPSTGRCTVPICVGAPIQRPVESPTSSRARARRLRSVWAASNRCCQLDRPIRSDAIVAGYPTEPASAMLCGWTLLVVDAEQLVDGEVSNTTCVQATNGAGRVFDRLVDEASGLRRSSIGSTDAALDAPSTNRRARTGGTGYRGNCGMVDPDADASDRGDQRASPERPFPHSLRRTRPVVDIETLTSTCYDSAG